ncbi:hypothetical protein QUF75_19180 [Desulfococcaceae bacterium HSG7]|nr:hypothetical protein [Desulfococcaceae bacterium HSG7]
MQPVRLALKARASKAQGVALGQVNIVILALKGRAIGSFPAFFTLARPFRAKLHDMHGPGRCPGL